LGLDLFSELPFTKGSMDAWKEKTGTERARVSSGASSSDSEERIVPVTISLDFDPVEFQAAALKTISKCSGVLLTLNLWRVLLLN